MNTAHHAQSSRWKDILQVPVVAEWTVVGFDFLKDAFAA